MPTVDRAKKRKSTTTVSPETVEQADATGKAEREFQRDADVILELLADGLPHTRVEVGALAAKNGISDARLGAIKRRMKIADVRVQQGSENGLGRSVVAWVIKK